MRKLSLESSRLLRPALFLCVRAEGLGKYRWRYPLIWLSVLIVYLLLYPGSLPEKRTILDMITASCTSLLTVLPGFYIAALAAIATFPAPTMDKPLEGHEAYLVSREGGEKEQSLTRRRFLCLLFGYLSFLSLVLWLLHTLVKVASPAVFLRSICPELEIWVEILLMGLICLFFLQLICLTLLSLFYLSDRIHWKKTNFKVQ